MTADEKPLDASLYADYIEWKGWQKFFVCEALDHDRFARDLAGIDLRGKALLEIGFGQGALLAWARERGAEVSGCELTRESLSAAEKAGITLVDPSFEESGALAPDSLDIVVAIDVFEHLEETVIRRKLFAIARALRPGGFVVLRYPNGQSPFGLIAQHGDVTHKVALSELKVEQLALGSGLETWRYTGATFARHRRLAHRIVTAIRGYLRRVIIRTVQFAFATDVELDPVMIHILRKSLAMDINLHSGDVPLEARVPPRAPIQRTDLTP
ncbi:class I SAM-dependent methyltransferase [Novosphingobium tardum]|uniref:Class I SAM-dependent methyltransferase n=1 Tax=Novosphingobium tardum TaxID=1538021 RepID=A0ABV8RKS9_9SPHN